MAVASTSAVASAVASSFMRHNRLSQSFAATVHPAGVYVQNFRRGLSVASPQNQKENKKKTKHNTVPLSIPETLHGMARQQITYVNFAIPANPGTSL